MQISRTVLVASLAFVAGAIAARQLPVAFAQAPIASPMETRIVDVTALEGEIIGPIVPTTELRSRLVLVTDQATIAVQQGNVAKHFHSTSDEVQYILSGSGTMWLGDTQRSIKAGDLIMIPKGVNHGGTIPASGTFKAIAIKLPPQAPGDTHFVN